MYEWKMPLKYWGMLSSLSGPLGLGQAADTMVGGGTRLRSIYSRAGNCTVSYVHSHQVQKTCLQINYFRFSPQPWHGAALAPTMVCGMSMPKPSA